MKTVNLRSKLLVVLCGSSLGLLAGCGTETYNQRLSESAELLDHINVLKDNLGRPWAEQGVEIRMPLQYSPIAPPAVAVDEEGQPVIDEDGNPVFDGPDERQPHYMTEPLPGLLAAWSGNVEADVSGEPREVKAYAYLLASHDAWLSGDVEGAAAFHTTVLESIVNGLSLTAPADADWRVESYPPKPGFIPQQQASVLVMKSTRFVDETRAEISLHLFENGDNKIALVFVYPDTINPTEKLTERIDLALETLQISGERPAAYNPNAAGGGGGGNAPAGGAF